MYCVVCSPVTRLDEPDSAARTIVSPAVRANVDIHLETVDVHLRYRSVVHKEEESHRAETGDYHVDQVRRPRSAQRRTRRGAGGPPFPFPAPAGFPNMSITELPVSVTGISQPLAPDRISCETSQTTNTKKKTPMMSREEAESAWRIVTPAVSVAT